jgi:iron complex transport system substrate-binding protein
MRQTALVIVLAVGLVVGAVPATALPAGSPAAGPADATQQQCSFPVTVTDGTGAEVTVDDRPERIVALQASTAQIMWDVGVRERVVGMPVREYTAYLNGSESKTDVLTGDGSAVDVEQVVALEPDLVVAPDIVPNATVDQLRSAGLTVYKSGLDKSIESIYEKTDRYGRLVGSCETADAVVEETRSTVEEVRSAVEGREAPRTLYYFYNFTAGSDTFVHEILETAGADNVAARANVSGFQPLNREIVAERNPQWLVHPSDAPLPTGEPFTGTVALQQNRTLSVNANYMNQAAPRFVLALERIAETLHPEAFENGTATPNATTETTVTTDTPVATDGGTTVAAGPTTTDAPAPETDGESTPAPTTTSSGSGPGFGVLGAVVALVAAGLLARRD